MSQAHRSEKGPAHRDEKKGEGLALKMKKGSPAYRKKKISFGPQKKDEGNLAERCEEVIMPKEVQ